MTIEERLLALEERVKALEGGEAKVATSKKVTSLREFINRLLPKTGNDVALVIGYFIETVQGMGYFNNDLLRAGFAEAKIIAPKNLSDVVAQNAKKGYIMPSTNPDAKGKAWVLTNTGEAAVEQMNPDD
jgi:O-acetylhomoserine/O-acetylserine sulfhydrylase-like pyridoxal-dependent enzyme